LQGYGERDLESLSSEELYAFLHNLTHHTARSTARLRYAQLTALFAFAIERLGLRTSNPCQSPLLRKTFRVPKSPRKQNLDRDTVDELIYRTTDLRTRLLIELQARCGLRIGEALGLTAAAVEGRKLCLATPKSGHPEVAFMPIRVAERLHRYLVEQGRRPEERIFWLSYSGARALITRAAAQVGITLTPHDLRRHAATFASRSGVPLEIVSKVLLRHKSLRTTQVYLGRVMDSEALRWMDILYG
jgi:integrase